MGVVSHVQACLTRVLKLSENPFSCDLIWVTLNLQWKKLKAIITKQIQQIKKRKPLILVNCQQKNQHKN